MIFLIWYRAKVLSVLQKEFQYHAAVPGHQAEIFNAVTRHTRRQGGNEFDGAIAFMLVQMNALPDPSTPDARAFIGRVKATIEVLPSHTKLGREADTAN